MEAEDHDWMEVEEGVPLEDFEDEDPEEVSFVITCLHFACLDHAVGSVLILSLCYIVGRGRGGRGGRGRR